MNVDLLAGRRLESPWLSGAIVKLGAVASIPTPLNRAIDDILALYVEGRGGPKDIVEAYKWYLIAAHAGDTESRASAQRLKGQLSAEAQAAAEARVAAAAPLQAAE